MIPSKTREKRKKNCEFNSTERKTKEYENKVMTTSPTQWRISTVCGCESDTWEWLTPSFHFSDNSFFFSLNNTNFINSPESYSMDLSVTFSVPFNRFDPIRLLFNYQFDPLKYKSITFSI